MRLPPAGARALHRTVRRHLLLDARLPRRLRASRSWCGYTYMAILSMTILTVALLTVALLTSARRSWCAVAASGVSSGLALIQSPEAEPKPEPEPTPTPLIEGRPPPSPFSQAEDRAGRFSRSRVAPRPTTNTNPTLPPSRTRPGLSPRAARVAEEQGGRRADGGGAGGSLLAGGVSSRGGSSSSSSK